MRRVTKAYVIKLEQKCRRLQETLEDVKADDKRHSEEARTLRELNQNLSQRLDDHERMRTEFQSDVARLERARDQLVRNYDAMEAQADDLAKQRDDLLKKCEAFNESLRWALTHSFHHNPPPCCSQLELKFDVLFLEANVKSASERIFNDEQEQKRLQDLLNGTAIAVGILGQKLSRG